MRRSRRRRAIGKWYEYSTQPRFPAVGVALSAAAHVLLIGVFVDASGPSSHQVIDSDFRPVFYLPPPNRPITEMGTGERLEFVMLGTSGTGTGLSGSTSPESDAALSRAVEPVRGGDQSSVAALTLAQDEEPVFTVVEVDEEAVRVANSAAPAYPSEMLAAGIEGTVVVRYIVDTEGLADVNSLIVLSATRKEFADAVRRALPHMRFSPARIDNRPVRQLVEQPFSFRIQRVQDTLATARNGSD